MSDEKFVDLGYIPSWVFSDPGLSPRLGLQLLAEQAEERDYFRRSLILAMMPALESISDPDVVPDGTPLFLNVEFFRREREVFVRKLEAGKLIDPDDGIPPPPPRP